MNLDDRDPRVREALLFAVLAKEHAEAARARAQEVLLEAKVRLAEITQRTRALAPPGGLSGRRRSA